MSGRIYNDLYLQSNLFCCRAVTIIDKKYGVANVVFLPVLSAIIDPVGYLRDEKTDTEGFIRDKIGRSAHLALVIAVRIIPSSSTT